MLPFLLSTAALGGTAAVLAVLLGVIFRDLVLPTPAPRIDAAGLRWQVAPARRSRWAGVAFALGIATSAAPALTPFYGITVAILTGTLFGAATLGVWGWARRRRAMRVDAAQLHLPDRVVDLLGVEDVAIDDGCLLLWDTHGQRLDRVVARGSELAHLEEVALWIRRASLGARAPLIHATVPPSLQRLRSRR